jgi:Family of unknown function (DUF6065)
MEPMPSGSGAWRPLIAHSLGSEPPKIVPAPVDRAWISTTDQQFARRCLPLLIANQSGWMILNSVPFQVMWTGRNGAESLTLSVPGEAPKQLVTSHFGYGILTFYIPFIIQTPPGYNLLARGPANSPKDGVYPLEGIVETDWAASPFTMNWKVTRPFEPIHFAADEPICMIVPQRRRELEEFRPEVRPLYADHRLEARYDTWASSRRHFLNTFAKGGPPGRGWQGHYFRGHDADDASGGQGHQTRLRLQYFAADQRSE